MTFIIALLVAVCFSFAAEWTEFTEKPKLVESSGGSYYEISSAKELAWFSKEVASGKKGINAVLKNDINLWNPASGDTNYWSSIGPADTLAFEGVFDGNGKTIWGARSVYKGENQDTLVNGFFRYVGESGVVKNLSLKHAFFKTVYAGSDTITDTSAEDAAAPQLYSAVGGIVGYNKGLLQNVSFVGDSVVAAGDSKITSGAATGNIYIVCYIAGNIAAINAGTIDGFESASQINIKNKDVMSLSFNIGYIGGVVGINRGSIKNGVNREYVNLPNIGFVGGICGYNYGSIENVENKGEVYNNEGNSGGVTGYNLGTIRKAVVMTSVRGNAAYGAYGGGIAAYNNGTITESGIFQTKGANLSVSKRAQEYEMMGVSILKAEGNAGGIAGTQGPDGVIENCGAAIWMIGIAISSTVKSKNLYSAGLVGLDSGSVIGSYAANSTLLQGDKYKPMYYIVDSTKKHESNHYDSTYLSAKFADENAGLPTSTMRSAKYAWLLNTQMGTAKNNGVWTYDDWYPIIANLDRIPTYRVTRYVNNAVYDTVYTNYQGHAIWGENVPEDENGNSLARWEFRNGTSAVEVPSSNVFKSDTSVHAVMGSKEKLTFTVTFVNLNDTILQKIENVPYGTLPEYSGADMFRDSTGQKYRYTFKGWNPSITEVHYDQVYKAVYDSTIRIYDVRYYATCGNRVQTTSERVYYGNKLSACQYFYPSSCSDSLYEYVYKGFTVNCDSFIVQNDTTIYAVYDTIPLSSSATGLSSSSEKAESSSSAKIVELSSSSQKESFNFAGAGSHIKFNIDGRTVYLDGAKASDWVAVFDLQGNLVKRANSVNGRVILQMNMSGTYILRYGSETYRFLIK